MEKLDLNKKEKMLLYGLVKYPNFTDKQLADKLEIKQSTVTSIRNRLKNKDLFRRVIIPRLQNLGCQMLVTIYTSFSPLIPLEERVEITGNTIEVFEEIFFSAGEQDKGFSLSLSKDYATIGKINDIRTQTFGGRGLLEEEYPNIIVFPFDISKIYRFFDFSPLLKKKFDLNIENDEKLFNLAFKGKKNIQLTETEKNIFCMMISYPELTDGNIAKELDISRHTVSRLKRGFEKNKLIRRINLPNLKEFGFEILVFYHIRFDPRNPPNIEKDESANLISDSTIFFACRQFESVMISVYKDYDDFKSDSINITQLLKQNGWIASDPIILSYSINKMIFIKDFKFAPITQKIVGCDSWIKKLLNI